MVLSDESNPLTNEFDSYYISYPLVFIEEDHHLETGNNIIMPPSAHEQLSALPNVVRPMLFSLENSNMGLHYHCGVDDFTADEGVVYLPAWMMKKMQLKEGDPVNIKNTSLPEGTSIKIQPRDIKFINLPEHVSLFEETIEDFDCLTTGETIVIEHEGEKYMIDIIETKPSDAISFGSDCVIEFETPLDCKEPGYMIIRSVDDEKLEGVMKAKDDKSEDKESSVANEQQTEITSLWEKREQNDEQALAITEMLMELVMDIMVN